MDTNEDAELLARLKAQPRVKARTLAIHRNKYSNNTCAVAEEVTQLREQGDLLRIQSQTKKRFVSPPVSVCSSIAPDTPHL